MLGQVVSLLLGASPSPGESRIVRVAVESPGRDAAEPMGAQGGRWISTT